MNERKDFPHRRTKGIVSDSSESDPQKEADVIITAAALGFAASYIAQDCPIQFDRDPLEIDQKTVAAFNNAVAKIDEAIAEYLEKHGLEPHNKVHAGTAPGYTRGAVIVGVYTLAGHSAPPSVSAPILSAKGQALYAKIKNEDPTIMQYTGRGAYTGFVDNANTEGNTDPVGPRPTARFVISPPQRTPHVHPRWLPPQSSPLWNPRKRKGTTDSYVPWGMIMESAKKVAVYFGRA